MVALKFIQKGGNCFIIQNDQIFTAPMSYQDISSTSNNYMKWSAHNYTSACV